MPTSPILGITQVAANQSQKEVTINNAIDALEAAQNATLICDFNATSADKTLTVTEFTRNIVFRCVNATGLPKLIVPSVVSGQPTSRIYVVRNESGAPINVTTNLGGVMSVTVPDSATRLLYTVGGQTYVAAEAASTSNFKDLLDVPGSYAGQALKIVRVKAAENGLEFDAPNLSDLSDIDLTGAANGYRLTFDSPSGKWIPVAPAAVINNLLDLTDTPNSYATLAGYFARVKAGEDGIEFVSIPNVDQFTDLSDVPNSFAGQAGKALVVNIGETGLTFGTAGGGGGAANFYQLLDVPTSYVGQAGKVVRVKATEDGLEYITTLLPDSLEDFPDFAPGTMAANALKSLRVNAAGTALEYYTAAAGVTTFTALSDTPNDYTGQAGKNVRVKGTEDGLEFYTPTAPTQYYRIIFSIENTKPNAGEVILRHVFTDPVNFADDFAGSRARLPPGGANPATNQVFNIYHNGAAVGTLTVTTLGACNWVTTGGTLSVAAGDELRITAPAGSTDATLIGMSGTVRGVEA